MKARLVLYSLLALVLTATPALAHFVWVAVDKDSAGQDAAHVWFSELAEPDSADLLDKITSVKVWSRTAAGKPTDVKVAKQALAGGGGSHGRRDSVPIRRAIGLFLSQGFSCVRRRAFFASSAKAGS